MKPVFIRLACEISETHNLQAVFLRFQDTKRESWSPAFLVEAVETGNKNRWVTEVTHVLRRKLREDEIKSFSRTGRSTNSIAFNSITLEKMSTIAVENKKKKNFN